MKIIKTAGLRFLADEPMETWRAKTLITKEEGTVRWIQREVKPGEVFVDVGASTGIYSLLAAQQGAMVYAFEPHILSARSLIINVCLNHMHDRVKLLTCALHSRMVFKSFNYKGFEPGSSGGQFGHTRNETGDMFVPVLSEIKFATDFDRLVTLGDVPAPHHVKIDVDGNELEVLRGMAWCFGRDRPLRSVQVEMHPVTSTGIAEFMASWRFEEADRHYTSLGKEAMASGVDPSKVFSNAVFMRRL